MSSGSTPTSEDEQLANPKALILVASIVGALLGSAFAICANPENNFYYFILLFVMIGVLLANLVLLALHEILKQNPGNN